MARINLLPWRAERRKQRQQEFFAMLGLAAGIGVLVSFLVVMYYNGQIEGQMQRNQYLRDQITLVDQQIKEIEELDKKKANLLKRKQVIEDLQASRSQMVHLFDQLVRTIPEGVRLNSIKQAGQQLTLEGQAQSNARVSSYMRNLEESGWMANPDLTIIEAKGDDRGLPNMFSLKVRLQTPKAEEEGADAGAAPATASVPAAGGAQ
ncbi:MAG TPA: PilN domain-containing protein [Arenimonas sp.]|nr:PilN domain-containing protein [Arenimonas sp.]